MDTPNTPEEDDLFDEMAEEQADYLAALREEELACMNDYMSQCREKEKEADDLAAELRAIEEDCFLADQQEEMEEDNSEEFYVIRFP